MRKNLVFIIFFVFFQCSLIAENLVIKDADYFAISDFNNDGKPDLILYFQDGRFGVSLNKSISNDGFVFDKVIYIEAVEGFLTQSRSVNKELETKSQSEQNIKRSETDTDLRNTKNQIVAAAGKLLSKKELDNFLNDSQTKEQKSTKDKKNQVENGSNKKITLAQSAENKTAQEINIQEDSKISHKTSETPEKKATDDSGSQYDVFILNFLNKSGTTNEDIQWLEKGFQELLLFELKLKRNLRIAPLEVSAKMNSTGKAISSGIYIYGEYSIVEKNIILTAFINNRNSISTVKIAEKNDNNGILTLVTKLSYKLDDILKSN